MKTYRSLFFFLLIATACALAVLYLIQIEPVVLNPKGWVGVKQKDLLVIATLLMLIVVIPVFALTGFIVWKYRAHKQAEYTPDWGHSALAETIWWGIPCLIIVALGVMNWKSSYELDPFRPLEGDKKTLLIQVVALDWKWLFIYPEQQIAVVNFMPIPEKTPIRFEITADAPMNSFWIPELGGQIFAMPGMTTELHLIADQVGEYRGCSANLSGKGFAGMTFIAPAYSDEEFHSWVSQHQESPSVLDRSTFTILSQPSEYDPIRYYSIHDSELFDWIVMKNMTTSSKDLHHAH